MARVLISILSDHIIPNYLYIKEMSGMFDDQIYITTEYAEKKEIGINLENTLGIKHNSTRRIVVSNENYRAVLKKLREEDFSKEDSYCINQTGGTKAMSIALFYFFQDYDSEFIYIPFGTNEYFNFIQEEGIPIKYRLNLKEYFSLYGMTYECDNSFVLNKDVPNRIFNQLEKRNFYFTKDIIFAHQKATPEERRFWSGEWFEEYTYSRILDEYTEIGNDAIAKSVKVYRKGSIVNDNEIDVAFVKDNNLYIIECKVSMHGFGSTDQETVEKYLYKIAAIMKDLGLKVNSYLFTLHKMNKFSQNTLKNIDKRRLILGINGLFDGPRLSKLLNI